MGKNKKKHNRAEHVDALPSERCRELSEDNGLMEKKTNEDSKTEQHGGVDTNELIKNQIEGLKEAVNGNSTSGEDNKLKVDITENNGSKELSSRNELTISRDKFSMSELEQELESVKRERDKVKEQYDNLLSKLSSMKSIFTKMKESQEELEETKSQLEASQEKNAKLALEKEHAKSELEKLKQIHETMLSQDTDLNQECDRLTQTLANLRKEYQNREETLQDEKYELENSNNRLSRKLNDTRSELNELLAVKNELEAENNHLLSTIDDLKENVHNKGQENIAFQNKIKELETVLNQKQDLFKATQKDQNEKIADLEQKVVDLNKEKEDLTITVQKRDQQIESMAEELRELENVKKEVNNKQLLIGKLRHEAIILNEHLTKSLTMLKQQLQNLNNTIDKDLVSNLILSFLQFPRGDTKKYEALQLISALLEWDESQKVSAGLMHGSQSSHNEFKPSRQSFVSLWTDFLEKESGGSSL